MEKKYYLVDSYKYEGEVLDLSNEEFKQESIKQGLVYTQKEFINSFNYGGKVNTDTQYLRIL